MSPELVYLSGPPGVGKSTLMFELTGQLKREAVMQPFAHDWLIDPDTDTVVAVELGRRREGFSGTDALGMAVSPRAIEWIKTMPCSLVLGEGDRLATTKFLSAAQESGRYRVTLVNLTGSPRVLADRRAERGSTQNEQWMKGRETKADNLARVCRDVGMSVITIDTTTMKSWEIARFLRAQVEPLRKLGAYE